MTTRVENRDERAERLAPARVRARAVLDAVKSTGMVYNDDSQVVVLIVRKGYIGRPDDRPGVHITVRRFE